MRNHRQRRRRNRYQNPIGWGQRWADELCQVVAASRIFMPLIDGSYWLPFKTHGKCGGLFVSA
jgi:hypothetical protein